MRIGAIVTILGSWGRYFATDFRVILVGQVAIASVQPFLYTAISRIATVWFPDK